MTSTSFVFTELANTMKYGRGFLYNLVFTEWRHCVSQNEVWGRGCYITLFLPSDVTAFHRIRNNESICEADVMYKYNFTVKPKGCKWLFKKWSVPAFWTCTWLISSVDLWPTDSLNQFTVFMHGAHHAHWHDWCQALMNKEKWKETCLPCLKFFMLIRPGRRPGTY